MDTLGDRLTYLREKNGWTKTYVAKKLGIKTMSTYANWEYNLRQPDNDMLLKIANIYEVSVDYLLGRNTAQITSTFDLYNEYLKPVEDAKIILSDRKNKNTLTSDDEKLLNDIIAYERNEKADFDPIIINRARTLLKQEKDIAKRLKDFKEEIENSDGLAFDGEPMSEEAKESLIESMEHIFRQTQRINKKYTPKKN